MSGLIRAVEAAGGFATVVHKGEREAGTILLILTEKGTDSRLFERMPSLDGKRSWHCTMKQDIDNKSQFEDYVSRRAAGDPDLWIVELDIVDGERLIGSADITG